MWRVWCGGVVAVLLSLVARDAAAFCGFYVAGAGGPNLHNQATNVVLMRSGTRTVLSMQNNYQGPAAAFAMVVPVPVVLQKEQVKTLPNEVFTHVDELGAPRLVEYWEQDPCPDERAKEEAALEGTGMRAKGEEGGFGTRHLGVTVEAEFTVAEYEIVILSASDALGLDTWLRENQYAIPNGAEPILRPYIAAGSKFFVAKVDPEKVKFDPAGKTMLSPLRFHYDTDAFTLPVRLGLLNSAGIQDLVVNVLGKTRFEVANHPNVFIPTNVDVADDVRNVFPKFYASLFDRTLAERKGAVVTEYAWDSRSCDPCPVEPLGAQELATLGADVLAEGDRYAGMVLTRLHTRYSKDSLGEDLVFRAAPAVMGGREDESIADVHGAVPAETSSFQARYVIRHPWTGPVTCSDPEFGQWGDPPEPNMKRTIAAKGTAFAERGANIADLVIGDVPEIALKGKAQLASRPMSVRWKVWAQDARIVGAAGALLGVLLALVVLVPRPRRLWRASALMGILFIAFGVTMFLPMRPRQLSIFGRWQKFDDNGLVIYWVMSLFLVPTLLGLASMVFALAGRPPRVVARTIASVILALAVPTALGMLVLLTLDREYPLRAAPLVASVVLVVLATYIAWARRAETAWQQWTRLVAAIGLVLAGATCAFGANWDFTDSALGWGGVVWVAAAAAFVPLGLWTWIASRKRPTSA